MTLQELLKCKGDPITYANLIERRNELGTLMRKAQQRIYDADDAISCFEDGANTEREKELLKRYEDKKARAEMRLAKYKDEYQQVTTVIKAMTA